MINTILNPVVHSMHWDNIDKSVINGQRKVFDALGIPLEQHNADRVQHGKWMDAVVNKASDDSIIVFCDIDAFPTNYLAYQQSVIFAEKGGLFGLAQFSNHKPTQHLYAGPMFMAFSKELWYELDQPSFERTKVCDAGEGLTLAAIKQNKQIQLVKPNCCLEPKWALKDQGVFGIGTFYGECDFFHLFESRQPEHEILFGMVVDDVIMHQPLRFNEYLNVMKGRKKSSKSFWRKVFKK